MVVIKSEIVFELWGFMLSDFFCVQNYHINLDTAYLNVCLTTFIKVWTYYKPCTVTCMHITIFTHVFSAVYFTLRSEMEQFISVLFSVESVSHCMVFILPTSCLDSEFYLLFTLSK